jgi:hypothetical protein
MSIEQHTPAKRSFTITEWTAMRGYSRVFFYKLRERGDAPLTIGTGKAQRISAEEDQRWLKRQEAKARAARKAG